MTKIEVAGRAFQMIASSQMKEWGERWCNSRQQTVPPPPKPMRHDKGTTSKNLYNGIALVFRMLHVERYEARTRAEMMVWTANAHQTLVISLGRRRRLPHGLANMDIPPVVVVVVPNSSREVNLQTYGARSDNCAADPLMG